MKLYTLTRYFLGFLFFFPAILLTSQSSSFKLDSTFQSITVAGVATSILAPDDLEIQFNNSLSSFWYSLYEFSSDNFRRTANHKRITFFSETLRLQYGFSKNQRWDLGFEAKFNWYRDDDYARSSPLRVFNNNHKETGTSYNGLAGLGIRFRGMPLASKPNWIVQAQYSFPIGDKEEFKNRLLKADLNQVDLITTYFEAFNSKTYYFLQANWASQFSPRLTNHIAGGAFYLVRDLWNGLVYVFPGISYTFGAQTQKRGISTYSHLVFAGLGGQYALRNNLQVYANWQFPLLIDNGSIFSDFVRSSYTSLSFGIRLTIDR